MQTPWTTRDLGTVHRLSILAALLTAAASLAGLLLPQGMYPAEALRRSFLANDVVNLVIGLPVLLAAMSLARRGNLPGLLFWPGALLYLAYNFLIYAIAMPLTWQSAAFLALAILSGWLVLQVVSAVDGKAVRGRVQGKVAERLGGGTLVAFGTLFFLLALVELVRAQAGESEVLSPALATRIADLLITPLWLAGGVLLWRKHPLGYVSGAGLLFQAGMLFVGLLVFFVVQPFVAGLPFPVDDFVVVLVMGLVVFVPLGMFLRGLLTVR